LDSAPKIIFFILGGSTDGGCESLDAASGIVKLDDDDVVLAVPDDDVEEALVC
jgi:hypothetical protein